MSEEPDGTAGSPQPGSSPGEAPPPSAPRRTAWEVLLPEEGATEDMAAFLASFLRPGDLVALFGGLGAGKTTLARAMIRELARDPALEVPSPTFTLMQPYETGSGRTVIHADLYRLRGPDELVELGFDELSETAITLVEWPERLGRRDNPTLTVELSLRAEYGEEARLVRIDGTGDMSPAARVKFVEICAALAAHFPPR